MNDLIVFLSLLGLSAFFSGTETAVTSLNEFSFASYEMTKNKRNILDKLIAEKSSVISALLVGNNIVNTVLAVYAGHVANDILVDTNIFPSYVAPIIASFVSIVSLLIFGEVLPKQIAIAYAKGWSSKSAYLLKFLVIILKPIIRAMDSISKMVFKVLPKGSEAGAPTVEELMLMAESSKKAGNIDELEKSLMFTSSHLNDLTAEDVMIPKNKIICAKSDISATEILEVFKTHLYSRIPIYENSIDEIIGVFNIKECFRLEYEKLRKFDIKKHLTKPIYIPGNVKIGSLMEEMKSSRVHFAVVVNEYGITDGIVTLENILERIIGLISDEYDEGDDEQLVRKENSGIVEVEVDGTYSLTEFAKDLKKEFPASIIHKVKTINGLLTYLKGDFVLEGEEFTYKDMKFKVISRQGLCAEKVKVTKVEGSQTK